MNHNTTHKIWGNVQSLLAMAFHGSGILTLEARIFWLESARFSGIFVFSDGVDGVQTMVAVGLKREWLFIPRLTRLMTLKDSFLLILRSLYRTETISFVSIGRVQTNQYDYHETPSLSFISGFSCENACQIHLSTHGPLKSKGQEDVEEVL